MRVSSVIIISVIIISTSCGPGYAKELLLRNDSNAGMQCIENRRVNNQPQGAQRIDNQLLTPQAINNQQLNNRLPNQQQIGNQLIVRQRIDNQLLSRQSVNNQLLTNQVSGVQNFNTGGINTTKFSKDQIVNTDQCSGLQLLTPSPLNSGGGGEMLQRPPDIDGMRWIDGESGRTIDGLSDNETVRGALRELYSNAYEYFAVVAGNLKEIKVQDLPNGLDGMAGGPRPVIYLSHAALSTRTPQELAGLITHEAYHNWAHDNGSSDNRYEEVGAINFELGAEAILGCSPDFIAGRVHQREEELNPTPGNINTWNDSLRP